MESPMTHVMKVSRNGQVSLPAEVRHRWEVDEVLVVDLGDKVVMRPVHGDRISALHGKYAGRGPSSQESRQDARDEEAQAEKRRERR